MSKIIIQMAIEKTDKRFMGFIEAEDVMDLNRQLNVYGLEGYGLAFNKDGMNKGKWPKRENWKDGEIQ